MTESAPQPVLPTEEQLREFAEAIALEPGPSDTGPPPGEILLTVTVDPAA
ncbi:hypothetical protein [Streptomyces chiangmaiensis]|uniref:Uncharacterized protein n=1 Tax=Streptomyces chiangmaiensis TaxID=766497 RepID=A0ABU7FFQ2_9ACTN|nr:hypothetical protein [Streptomyces chiangmaiensis]MED7822971.1 hypothetical protein [Streptomyces chiangmaiensis]